MSYLNSNDQNIFNNSAYRGVAKGVYGGGKRLINAITGLPGPASVDTSGVQQAQNTAFQTGNQLGNERQDYVPSIGQAQQAGALANLQQAAAGNVPSAAQLQAQQQANTGAAQQFGIASALQGGNSAGNTARNAMEGAANLQANVANAGMVNRANEMAQARGQYAQAVSGARGQDIDWQKALLGGQLQSNQTGTTAAGSLADANAKNAAAQDQYNGSLVGGITNFAKGLFSDKTLKEDVTPANLDKLAASLKGFGFRYKDQSHGEGQRVGIMAQDALKGGPAGRRLVERDAPTGKLKLDIGNSIGAALAMSAEALRRAKAS